MIGVITSEERHDAVREFFELFKTPWQFYREDLRCDVLICSGVTAPTTSVPLLIIYDKNGASSEVRSGRQTIVHFDFDLFAEVEDLLTRGQSLERAHIPTLDLHVEALRDLLLRHSVPLVEIPPIPAGYEFIACLTHDVDHPRIRDHFGDHTMFGFLYRALIGSVRDLIRGRKTLLQVSKNYRAAMSLPFVYLGIAPDFWSQFDRYREIEGDARSTFFVIPSKGDPGVDANGRKLTKRAARYDFATLSKDLERLLASGCEIAVHGIDAWRDPQKGRIELERIREMTKAKEVGIRMHWLFFAPNSPALLEQAGYSYDSTFGYNETVGYRAGTTQVFKPPGAQNLMELPMHAMDTAMFYRDYMNLSPAAATEKLDVLTDHAAHFGGALTINWHDRSLAPERLWDATYIELVEKLKRREAWMPTASEAISWFRARRAAEIEIEDGVASIALDKMNDQLPGLRLRAYRQIPRHRAGSTKREFTDFTFMHSEKFHLEPAAAKVSAA